MSDKTTESTGAASSRDSTRAPGSAPEFDEVWAEEPELRVRFSDLGNGNVRIKILDNGEVSMRREATVASWRFDRLVAKMRPAREPNNKLRNAANE